MGVSKIFSYGGKTVWMLIAGFIVAAILSVMLLTKTAELRYQRDVNRMVYNDNLGVLNDWPPLFSAAFPLAVFVALTLSMLWWLERR